jgi:hypothetical protein
MQNMPGENTVSDIDSVISEIPQNQLDWYYINWMEPVVNLVFIEYAHLI